MAGHGPGGMALASTMRRLFVTLDRPRAPSSEPEFQARACGKHAARFQGRDARFIFFTTPHALPPGRIVAAPAGGLFP